MSAAETNTGTAGPSPGRRILLVEDHADSARAMSRLLRALGFTVSVAARLDEARQLFASEQPDLLICDIALPDGNGLDLMRDFRAVCPTIKGIALSGHGATADLHRSRDAGFSAHVVKPIDFTRLREVIAEVVEA
jgi:hypothetical protein